MIRRDRVRVRLILTAIIRLYSYGETKLTLPLRLVCFEEAGSNSTTPRQLVLPEVAGAARAPIWGLPRIRVPLNMVNGHLDICRKDCEQKKYQTDSC